MKKLMKVAVLVLAMCLIFTGCQKLPEIAIDELPFELPFEIPFDVPFVHKHNWQAATCEDPMTCVCGATKGEPLGHTIVNVEGKEATCTETGLTLSKVCSVCGYVQRPQVEIPANGHTPGEPANCTNDQTCTECGVVLQESTGGVHVAGAAATCTTAQTCTFCDAVMEPAKGHTLNADNVCTVCGVKVYAYYFNETDKTKLAFTTVGTNNLGGIDWTLDAKWGIDGNTDPIVIKNPSTSADKMWRGLQIGAGNSKAGVTDWLTLTSAELTGVTRIRVRTQGAAGYDGKITVKVGDTVVLDAAKITDDPDGEYKSIAVSEGAAEWYHFEIIVPNLSGAVEIKIDQNDNVDITNAKAVFIGAISVDYAG